MTTSAHPSSADVPVEVTVREINELVRLFNASQWSSLELDLRGMRLVLGRHAAPAATSAPMVAVTPTLQPAHPAREVGAADDAAPPQEVAPAAPSAAPPMQSSSGRPRTEVTASVVGTFWVAPSPGEPPFVAVGDHVAEGQQLAIVEVMKLMSQVTAPVAGTVVEILADNAELVDYDRVLFVIESDDV